MSALSDVAHHQLLRVWWHDAHAATDGWTTPDEIDVEPYLVVSVGLLLNGCKPGHVVLAQSMIADHGDVDHVLAIPVAMVTRIETLHVATLLPVEPPA
jgi:hypothetical protein